MALHENAKQGKFLKLNVSINQIGVFFSPCMGLLELKKIYRRLYPECCLVQLLCLCHSYIFSDQLLIPYFNPMHWIFLARLISIKFSDKGKPVSENLSTLFS